MDGLIDSFQQFLSKQYYPFFISDYIFLNLVNYDKCLPTMNTLNAAMTVMTVQTENYNKKVNNYNVSL